MLTRQLAEFVVNTDLNDIPKPVLDGSRDALIDTIGCALAGSLEPISEIAARWVRETGARGQASLLGHPLKTSPAEAAFANGIAGHALDFDDSLPSLRGHPSTTMGPAALAVAESSGSSGVAVLAAFALGLEVAGKLGRAVGGGHYMRGWHTTGTIGAFSSTAAAARLWGLSVEELQTAWGLAASQIGGLVRNFGTMTKPFHAGNAARIGVTSAWMAKEGFTADTTIFDGEKSFFTTYGGQDGESLAEVLARMGKPWEMSEPGIYVKRWPCCYCNHRPLGGMIKLIAEHGIRAEEVTAVEVGFLPGSDTALVSTNPTTGLEGKFSIEYVTAALFLDGKVTLETFTDPMVMRPEVRAFMPKVKRYRIEAKGTYSGVVGYTDLAIDTQRGKFTIREEHAPGSPEAPMTASDRVEKFMDCAGRVLGERGAKGLLDQLSKLESISNVANVIGSTSPQEGSAAKATA
jgi:2-methylcitrate dehydratase PrpD